MIISATIYLLFKKKTDSDEWIASIIYIAFESLHDENNSLEQLFLLFQILVVILNVIQCTHRL
jgi:hypothetical protein